MSDKEIFTVRQGTDHKELLIPEGGRIRKHLILEEGASATIVLLAFPGMDCGMDFRVELAGQGASCRLSGLYLCPAAETFDLAINMLHNVPGCRSHQMFKGIVSGTAKAIFSGRIVVAPDACKTEAYQENHSLLLSDSAKVDTMPQLEIYADDVKCSHGAAIGKLDEEEQFYMRSRGIPEQEAKVLQMLSFLSPVMDMIPEGSTKDSLVSRIEQTIRYSF